MSCLLSCVLAAVSWSACAGVAVENGAFEQRDGEKPVGWRDADGFVCRHGVGLNGSGGLYWEGENPDKPAKIIADLKGWRPGEVYLLTALVRLEDFTHRDPRGVRIWFEWYDAKDKWLSCVAAETTASGTRDWTPIQCVTPPIPTNAVSLRLMPYVSKGSKGKVAIDNIAVSPYDRAPVAFVVSDAYRDVAVGGPVNFHAAFYPTVEEQKRNAFTAFFSWTDADGRACRAAAADVSARSGSIALDVGKMAMGASDVVCELYSAGRLLGSATNRFTRVAELPNRRVSIDRHGRCILDGKPFFPLGMYLDGSYVLPEKHDRLLTYAKSPFNCFMAYRILRREWLDAISDAGLLAIADLRDIYPGAETARRRNAGTTWAETEAWLDTNVLSYRDHPAVLGWYITDEAPPTEVASIRRVQEHVQAVDPDHPTWAVLATLHGLREFVPSFDVLGVDPYPVPRAGLEQVRDLAQGAKREIFGAKPMWNVPQAFSWWSKPTDRFPTREELRNIAFQHIACGANGIIAYIFGERFYKHGPAEENAEWKDVCTVGAEVKRFVPVFLSVERTPTVTADAADVPCRAWTKDGSLYVLTCNPYAEGRTVNVSVAEGEWTVAATELGTSGTMADARTLRLELPPIGVSFVRLASAAKGASAAPIPPDDETYLFKTMKHAFPKLRKMGAVSPWGECSPFVWKGRLMRMELYDPCRDGNPRDERICAIIRDVGTGKVVGRTGAGCFFHSIFVDGDRAYVTGVKRDIAAGRHCGDTILVFESADLVNWTERVLVRKPGWRLYNTTIAKGPDGYVLAVESDDLTYATKHFTMFFATSKDLREWTFLPNERAYPKHRYCGGPFLVWRNGWYYLTLVTELPCERYCTYLFRTKDFAAWECGRYNPFVMWDDEDRKVAPNAADITPEFAEQVRHGFVCNASDLEMCDFGGKTCLNYIVGDQHGFYYIAEAWYDGTMQELLERQFE